MPFVTAKTQKSAYDVIVVGSGAAGGQSAYTLCMDGAKVLMLEAGRKYSPETETPMFQTPDLAPLRADGTPDKPFGFYDATVGGGWSVPGEPYVRASEDDAGRFDWWRARMLGGRTNHWGRISLRNGPYDFKPHTRDGLGFDWPIGYEDLAPYYDKVELLIGVYGSNEGLENTPGSSPGCLLPPPKPLVSDLLIAQRAKRLGIPVIPGHRAVLTRPLDFRRSPARLHPGNVRAQRILAEDMRKRAACIWATPCGRGCRANGVSFFDRTTGRQQHATARVVVLAASSCETVRILLNSKSARFPNGLANSSGKVGRYLMDTVGSGLGGQVPLLESLPPLNEDGASEGHMYTPWWLYREQLAGGLGFARGYHIEFGGGKRMPPGPGTLPVLAWLSAGSYGRKFKEDARRYYGSFVYFDGRGEMIPNENSYCEIDPQVKDKWGIPVLRFHWQWSQHETRQAAHMQKTFKDIIEAMGGRVYGEIQTDGAKAIQPGGSVIHEVGGALMGRSAHTSVTNHWGQTWDVKNVFLADGAVFPSNADKNPTLTIMALAWRAADHILHLMRR